MTGAVMAAFGGGDVRVTDDSIEVDEGRYVPTTYRVEPDATSAGYPLAVAAVAGGAIAVARPRRVLRCRATLGSSTFSPRWAAAWSGVLRG